MRDFGEKTGGLDVLAATQGFCERVPAGSSGENLTSEARRCGWECGLGTAPLETARGGGGYPHGRGGHRQCLVFVFRRSIRGISLSTLNI